MYGLNERKFLYWGRKRVSEKVYNKRLQAQGLNELKKKKKEEAATSSCQSAEECSSANKESQFAIKGERIINMEFFANNLKCQGIDCGELLHLWSTEKETRKGFKSFFHIRCNSCLLVNVVPTGRQTTDVNSGSHFEFNHKLAMGLIQCGIAYTSFHKLCTSLDLPSMSRNTFQYYKERAGAEVEEIAQESCARALKLEKE